MRRRATRHSEFRYGSFFRVLMMPESAKEGDVHATYKDGILEIRVPLEPEPEVQPKAIPVERGVVAGVRHTESAPGECLRRASRPARKACVPRGGTAAADGMAREFASASYDGSEVLILRALTLVTKYQRATALIRPSSHTAVLSIRRVRT